MDVLALVRALKNLFQKYLAPEARRLFPFPYESLVPEYDDDEKDDVPLEAESHAPR